MLRLRSIRAFAQARQFATSSVLHKKSMPPRPKLLDESEFTEKFLCGSGPGGQKINKTSSAVQLKHIPTGLVLKVQATRSREQNRKLAREMLAAKIEETEKGADSRTAVVTATKQKRKSSAIKKSRRKYKALEAAKGLNVETPAENENKANGGDSDVEDRGNSSPKL